MRVVAVVVLAALLAPAALAHGGHEMHLDDVLLTYSPLDGGQRLSFVLWNSPSGEAVNVRAHVTVYQAMFREVHDLPKVPAGQWMEVSLPLPARAAPHACVYVTADHKGTEQVCALAKGVTLPAP